MGKILLFNVNFMKGGQIFALCKSLGHEVISIPKEAYGNTVSALISGNQIKKDYSGKEFEADMMLFSGIDSAALDVFLEEYKKAGIPPIQRKAVVTMGNFTWTAYKLYEDLNEHVVQGHKG